MLNASGHLIMPEFLPEQVLGRPESMVPGEAVGDDIDLAGLIEDLLRQPDGRLHERVVAAVERVLFTRVLRHTHGHQAQASETLGLNRSTLRHRLKTLGLAVDRFVTDAPGEGGG